MNADIQEIIRLLKRAYNKEVKVTASVYSYIFWSARIKKGKKMVKEGGR